jgi:hypothetical protein
MADSTATARYAVTTPGADVDAIATAIEGEAGVDTVEVIGHHAEDELTNKPAAATANRNLVELEIVASDANSAQAAETAITDAVTAEGSALTLVTNAVGQTGATSGFTLTADAPTLTADDDTPSQQEGAATVTVVVTLVQKAAAAGEATFTTDIDTVYAEGSGTIVGTDQGDDTFDIVIDTEAGDAALSPLVFAVTATDAIGQTITEVVTLTVTAA